MHSLFESIEDSDSDTVGPELITLAAVKLELGISGSSEDEWLDANITRWSQIIAEYCDRVFAFTDARETFYFDTWERSRDSAGLPLRLYPIIAVDSVTVDDTETEFHFDESSGLLWRTDRGQWGGTVVVEYSGGYDLPGGAPAALQLAVIEAIRGRRSAASTAGGVAMTGVRSITHGDTSITFSETASSSTTTASASASTGGLPITVAELIKPFKRLAL